MRGFRCDCGNRIYFENDRCLNCGAGLCFDPRKLELRPVRPGERLCASYAEPATCNWLAGDGAFCASCSLNEVIPDLSDQRRVQLYYKVEQAKRRLLYSLYALGLPVEEHGLSFRILADARLDGVDLDPASDDAVATGHLEGRITINLLEAEPHLRERMRLAMNERYRTLLGHFRHESGHYYWHRWREQAPAEHLEPFRAVFGDERRPYAEALDAYYRNGPAAGWQESHVGPYAASHPLEDFAECWAHYLHMFDTLETAADAELAVRGAPVEAPRAPCRPASDTAFEAMVADWRKLAPVMNDLNRSMGLGDAYPFALSPPVVGKLRFVHAFIAGIAGIASPAGAAAP